MNNRISRFSIRTTFFVVCALLFLAFVVPRFTGYAVDLMTDGKTQNGLVQNAQNTVVTTGSVAEYATIEDACITLLGRYQYQMTGDDSCYSYYDGIGGADGMSIRYNKRTHCGFFYIDGRYECNFTVR